LINDSHYNIKVVIEEKQKDIVEKFAEIIAVVDNKV